MDAALTWLKRLQKTARLARIKRGEKRRGKYQVNDIETQTILLYWWCHFMPTSELPIGGQSCQYTVNRSTLSEEPLLWMKWSLFSETRREILFWWKTKRKEIQVVNIFISQILHFAGKDNLRLKCNFWEYFRLGLGSFPAPCLSIFLVSFYLGYWVGQAVSFFQSWIFSDSSIFCPHSKIFNKPAWAMSI